MEEVGKTPGDCRVSWGSHQGCQFTPRMSSANFGRCGELRSRKLPSWPTHWLSWVSDFRIRTAAGTPRAWAVRTQDNGTRAQTPAWQSRGSQLRNRAQQQSSCPRAFKAAWIGDLGGEECRLSLGLALAVWDWGDEGGGWCETSQGPSEVQRRVSPNLQ